MNNNIDKLFLLIYNDEVVVIESNLTAFYTTIKSKEIDIGMGLTTLRNRMKDTLRIYIPNSSKQNKYYYIQKYLNDN